MSDGHWRIEPGTSSLSVWTEREGMLSPVGHDLILDAERFRGEVRVEGERARVELVVDTALRVRCARDGERELPAGVSQSDRRDIEKNLRKDVLRTGRFPEARFTAEGPASGGDGSSRIQLRGRLELMGRTSPVTVELQRRGDPESYEARVRLRQTDFGIKPFTALLGTLRVKDEVEVRASVSLQPVDS